jgi:membrane-associated PAP2 superfamily phosphatase
MLTLRDWRNHVLWPFLALGLAFLLVEFFALDRPIANALFFHSASGWLGAGRGDWWAHGIIHTDGRWLPRGVGAAALLCWALSFKVARLAPWRREALYVFLGVVVATALVGILKRFTNVDCPWDLAGFGGERPYITLFANRPDYLPHAECFPGAHSSSGFALMSVYFALRDRARRAARISLVLAIAVGLVFSFGQEARGAHFLSHDLASAGLTWFVLVNLYSWMLKSPAAATKIRAPVSTQAFQQSGSPGYCATSKATAQPRARRSGAGSRERNPVCP